jgi:ribonuclease HIII
MSEELVSYYAKLKAILSDQGFRVNPFREIQYGIQFIVFYAGVSGIVRLFDGKKGLRLDLSQVKEEMMLARLQELVAPLEIGRSTQTSFAKKGFKEKTGAGKISSTSRKDPAELIGIDESGKGDYFGPLVVAAVYVNPELSEALRALGVADSKTLNDQKIREIAPQIQELCPHSLVVLANQSYNEIYEKVQNLNHILSWGHVRVLENVLSQVECPYALSDQFGNPTMIRTSLLSKGLEVVLLSRPRAEDNIAVAAASVLARYHFLTYLQEMRDRFKLKIPKGSSDMTLAAAQLLVRRYGPEILPLTVKMHFKLTQQLSMTPGDE